MKTCVRVIALLLSLACLVLPAAAAGEAVALRGIAEDSVPDATGIGAAAVWNIENETFVYEHNIDALLAPASLVKLMTAVCAYEVLGDRMDETLTVEYSMKAATRSGITSARRLASATCSAGCSPAVPTTVPICLPMPRTAAQTPLSRE